MMIRLFLLLMLSVSALHAGWIVQNGKIQDADEAATLSCEEHFLKGQRALEERRYEEACRQFRIVIVNFPRYAENNDGWFFFGAALFEEGEYDRANEAFSQYLKYATRPKYFEETMTYKLRIADGFREGARRRLLGYKRLPKWSTGRTLALKIYEEISLAMPCHDYAAHALYCRGYMLWERGDFIGSIEAFQTLIRRFPKHELCRESYLSINRIFLDQCQVEYQNPDLLPLAEINLRRYKQEFPQDDRIEEAEQDVAMLKEMYAEGLYATGCFYLQQEKPHAAEIYFKKAITLFPDTKITSKCREKLAQ